MTNEIKALLLHIEEEVEGVNTDLKFAYDDDSVSFDLYDNSIHTSTINLVHVFSTNETTYTSNVEDDADYDDAIVTYTNDNSDYVVVTDNHLDIPLMYAPGVSYIVLPNHDLLHANIEVINRFPVCLTTIDNFAEDNPTVTSKVTQLDSSTFNTNIAISASLFEMAIASEKEGINGVDSINKFLHTVYKNVSVMDDAASANSAVIPSDVLKGKNVSSSNNLTSNETKTAVKHKTIVFIDLEELTADLKYQKRAKEDASAIKDLVTAYEDEDDVPAIEVIDTGNEYIIVDGFHRFAAATEAGLDSIQCEVTEGTQRDAFIRSLGANANNKALKRTNADKRKAVESALADEIFSELSSRDVASICRVSHTIVNRIRKELKESGNVSTLDDAAVVEEAIINHVVEDTSTPEPPQKQESGNVSTSKPSNTSKPFRKTLSSNGVSVVLNIQTIENEEALNELLADLNGAVESYISMLEEVNK